MAGKMEFDIDALKAAASAVVGRFTCSEDCVVGKVAAAVLSDSGEIYTGICIDSACSLGFCAEHAAIAEMLKHRQTRIVAVVAVKANGAILPPCGRCREFIYQVNRANLDTQVILGNGRIFPLSELLPHRS